jgi:hypothetical protein
MIWRIGNSNPLFHLQPTPSVAAECMWGCSLRNEPARWRKVTAPNLASLGDPGLCLRTVVLTARMNTRRTPLKRRWSCCRKYRTRLGTVSTQRVIMIRSYPRLKGPGKYIRFQIDLPKHGPNSRLYLQNQSHRYRPNQ